MNSFLSAMGMDALAASLRSQLANSYGATPQPLTCFRHHPCERCIQRQAEERQRAAEVQRQVEEQRAKKAADYAARCQAYLEWFRAG